MEEQHMETKEKKSYLPLIFLIGVGLLMGFSIARFSHWMVIMQYFMGSILCLFSLVKLFDIKGFASSFATYDLLASKFIAYGYVYPFIELGLGLGILSNYMVSLFALITVLFMAFGSLGVFKAIKEKKDLSCACMGSIIKVPLSVVSLLEDLLMGVMGIILFFDKL